MNAKLYKAQCPFKDYEPRARSRTELLNKLRKHLWKDHREWMIGRIKAGLKRAKEGNPSIQDLVGAIRSGSVRAAMTIRGQMSESRFQQAKVVLDAFEPEMPNRSRFGYR